MRELPKELTPELLSLVLKRKIKNLMLLPSENKFEHMYINFQYVDVYYGGISGIDDEEISIDTLTRIMIDWCLKQNEVYKFQIDYHNKNTELTHLVGKTVVTVNEENNNFIGDVLSKAVLKATHWVAKEKGYIKFKK